MRGVLIKIRFIACSIYMDLSELSIIYTSQLSDHTQRVYCKASDVFTTVGPNSLGPG